MTTKPRTQSHTCASSMVEHFEMGDIVRAGALGAAWRISTKASESGQTTFTLVAVDPHDVPISQYVGELPL